MIPVTISILLPVFNAEKYLSKSIDSILNQTFIDFELIIINDGSVDQSDTIIRQYKDPRIVYLVNDSNKGLIYSLNRGIDTARGKYIARMDADDICLPNRLNIQQAWLNNHPGIDVVCSFSDFIDENDQPKGFFPRDRQFVSAEAIRNRLPFENLISHPTIMARASLLKEYKYNPAQKNIEDYDLWLRLAGDGHLIEKIPQSLLLYRVHQSSITLSKLRKANFFIKHFHCKRKYLTERIRNKRFNTFDLRVLLQMNADLVRASLKEVRKVIAPK